MRLHFKEIILSRFKKEEFGISTDGIGVGRTCFEPFLFVIIKTACLTAHNRLENEIDNLRNTLAASEILAEGDFGRVIFGFGFVFLHTVSA